MSLSTRLSLRAEAPAVRTPAPRSPHHDRLSPRETYNPDNDVLRATGITLARDGVRVLRDVSLAVRAEEVLAITGPPGCGKTTLAACLSGDLEPESGELWFNSGPVHTLGRAARADLRRRHFGFADGRAGLLPELTVLENTALPLLMDGTPRRDAFTAARHWLERVDADDHAGARPAALPRTVRCLVGVARALAGRPDVVFADEPAYGLDGPATDHLMRILVSAARSYRITVVLTTGDPRTAAHADRVTGLLDGRLGPGT